MDIQIKVQYKNDRLQELRKAAGMSQSQLAKAAGISLRMLQDYEQGARDINGAKLSTLLKLCIVLKCKLPEIITDEDTAKLLEEYGK